MSDEPKKPHPFIALRLNYKDAYDAIAMFIYLILVYGWGLWIYPLGRDYGHLANAGADLPFLARQLFGAEIRLFGANPVGYHLVNMALMYGCMLLVYHFVNASVRGLWWFGSLAACLFMANPVHSEAMHNLSGVGDLVPCLAGLMALTAYALHAQSSGKISLAVAVATAAFAAGTYLENAALGLVLLAYELLVVRKASRRIGRGIAIFAVTIVSVLVTRIFQHAGNVDLGQMFGPLYLVFYPIGFLPETIASFEERPWTAWLAAAAVAVLVGLMYRKARRPEFLFAVFGMLLLRIVPARTPVDLTHMIGGGQLLLPNVLFVLGFVVIVFRIMDHPRWRVPMVSTTTTLVIIMFAMQWASIKTWHDAGNFTRAFQAQAAEAAHDGEPVGVLPDFQYYRGAPVCLSESITYDTPFSKMVPHRSLLKIHALSLKTDHEWVRSWSRDGGEVVLPAAVKAPVYTWFPFADRIAYGVPIAVNGLAGSAGTMTVTQHENGALLVTFAGGEWPAVVVPENGQASE